MIEENNMPLHVAVIPDGNRRWAKERELEPWIGHEEGAKRIEEIARSARNLGVKYLSFWGSSVENLQKRSLREKKELLNIYEKYFEKLLSSKEIFEDEVRINVFGQWREQLPAKLVSIINENIEKTKKHKKYFLNFFLAYSGDIEMVEAVKSIVSEFNSGDEITKETIKKHLFTKDLPSVDYLIRTGGEPHLSAGFMMWDTANVQLFFSEEFFPNFGANEFGEAIDEYIRRARRLGA